MILSRTAINEFLRRDLNSYLWMKKLTRQQIEREMASLRVRPRFKTESWLHQLVCFWIALYEPRFLFLLDMGLGKSKIILDIITQLQRERKLEGALVTVPRMINMDSWQDDVLRHSELEPWLVNVSDIEEKWERLAYPKGDLTVIDYQGLQWAVCKKTKKKGKTVLVRDDKKIRHVQKQYNFLGIDESHKLSSHDNLWFGMMDQLCKSAEFCYATTGTLFGKRVEDLWSQFYLVDRGETFGHNLGLFRASFFDAKMSPWKGTVYTYRQSMDRELHRFLQNKSLRYDEDEVLDLPARVPRTRLITMSHEQRDHYLRAVQGIINAGGKLGELDAAWVRMRQIISGFLAWNDEHGNHLIRFKENPKLDALEMLLDEMGNNKMVIVHCYQETGRMITERLKSMGIDYEWLYGGTKDKSGARTRFIEDPKCRAFVMNDDAGGTGNDGLQKVARYMTLYETPTSPTARKQVIKRIHRPGQEYRTFITDLVTKGTIDKGILADLQEGTDIYNRVVNGRSVPSKKSLLDLLMGAD